MTHPTNVAPGPGDRMPDRRFARPVTSLDGMSPGEYRTLAQFRHVIRQFMRASEEMARAKGLTPQQHQLLLALEGRDPGTLPTIGYLADRLMIKHNSAVGLVDRLVNLGSVERVTSPSDRRQVLVRITDRGLETLSELSASHRRELLSLAPRLADALSSITGSGDLGLGLQ